MGKKPPLACNSKSNKSKHLRQVGQKIKHNKLDLFIKKDEKHETENNGEDKVPNNGG